MNLRKDLPWGLVFAALVIGIFTIPNFFREESTGAANNCSSTNETIDVTVQNSSGKFFSKTVIPHPEPYPEEITLLPIAEESIKLNRADTTPQDDLELLETLIEGYRRALKENPSGENGEIVAALMGRNSRGVAVIPTNHPALSAHGQLLDRWGTPYFFHPVSSQTMEIISAGSDKKLWTPDDIVLK